MNPNLDIFFKVTLSFFLISQYEQILQQNNMFSYISYILLLIFLGIDLLIKVFKIYSKK